MCKNLFYVSENTSTLHFFYKDKLLILRGRIAVYCENQVEYETTLCRQNAQLFNVKVGVMYSYHYTSHS
jgi:hypothetical protein